MLTMQRNPPVDPIVAAPQYHPQNV